MERRVLCGVAAAERAVFLRLSAVWMKSARVAAGIDPTAVSGASF